MNTDPRLMELAGRYAEGMATADEVRELESALRADPAFRRAFVRYLNVDSALGSAPVEDSPARPGRPLSITRWRVAGWAAAAAVVLAAAGVGLRTFLPGPNGKGPLGADPSAVAPAAPPPVVLVAATHARWADGDLELSLRSGDVPAGALRLESGSAEFRFAAGATALVLGPATLRFPGTNRLVLDEGRVLCRCPTPESRLTVTTPATQVVDLGTEFAVEVAGVLADTRVAVVSGEVRVGTTQSRVLRTGQAAEVGPDQVVRLTPIPPAALAELLAADAARSADPAEGQNLLDDPTFGSGPGLGPWRGLEGHVEPSPEGGAVNVFARGHRFWPSVRQEVDVGDDLAGRLVVASVDGRTPSADRLTERQSAILKVAFLDAQGREFATASRHFLHAGSSAFVVDQTVTSQVAAFAPPGTRKLQLQLMISARGRSGGMVRFSNPRLVVLPAPGAPNP